MAPAARPVGTQRLGTGHSREPEWGCLPMERPTSIPRLVADLITESGTTNERPGRRAGGGRRQMSRYERSKYLDKLIELRAAYTGHATEDQTSTMSIADVEAFAA